MAADSDLARQETRALRAPDIATAMERVVPDAVLARTDPALFGRTVLQLAQGWATHPGEVSRAASSFAAVSARIGAAAAGRALRGLAGGSVENDPSTEPVPTSKDGRFKDTTWVENPVYWALRQEYLALISLLEDLVGAASLDADADDRGRMLMSLVGGVVSPTNVLPGNPAALKRAFETGGSSVVAGLRNLLDDLATNGGKPRQVDKSGLRVGKELAATPGKVVYRNRLMELVQFEAQTDEVHAIPLLCSPPWINKYYVMDLAPERSLVEWAVQHGHTVFMISYRDPDSSMATTTFADYLELGPATALDVVQEITGADKVNLMGLCLGGLMAALLTTRCAERGDDRINSLTMLNTMLDYSDVGPISSFVSPEITDRLEKSMEQTGYLPAESMATTFDLLRANDLIFNYIGPNWLEGKTPPAFDILAWNTDSTRMPAAMHSFYLRHFYLDNELAKGELEIDGEPLSLKAVQADTFIVAAENDHIAPWRTSFTSTELLGGDVTFVLSTAGHIAGVVNPPSPKAKHWVGTVGATGADAPGPDAWRARSTEVKGSWWETWSEWIGEHGGEMVSPPPVGSDAHPVLGDAPGEYVLGSG
ncbi:alpha/beta fold hydrolase [Actinomycetospora sp. NBRC 106378]|uniref:PHA/PHB synthase family protein n=1 Tax=Actinomycetospora sp. NBRC 106378 TaxID=3032208 RepID=UPI0024A250E0|nr:alpha/beta fold hydrolase [Actinomycetospora sp. NBRC 106378]GLZ56174.1 class I poly(R)-hydroxyalkanoic acid synthase [Actinomycetospora sp. NBRC 106378]